MINKETLSHRIVNDNDDTGDTDDTDDTGAPKSATENHHF